MNAVKQISFAVAACAAFFAGVPSASFAAPSEPYVCYRPADGQASYPWDNAVWWYDGVSGSRINRIPTSEDHVFLYSSKNSIAKPMVVTNGVDAVTGILDIVDEGNNGNVVVGVSVRSGGTLTNHGVAYIGNSGSGKTGGGYLTVESGGSWTAKANFLLGMSKGVSWLNIAPDGIFTCEREFTAGGLYGMGIVTNKGTAAMLDLFVGGSGSGVFVNEGSLNVSQKFTIARNANSSGRFVHAKGATLSKTRTKPLLIANGSGSTGVFESNGDIAFDSSDTVQIAVGANSDGRLVVGEGAVVSNMASVLIGSTNVVSQGTLDLRGGTFGIRGSSGSGYALFLGKDGEGSNGRISGWGTVSKVTGILRMTLYGQVVADGEGVERDLNLADVKTIGLSADDALNTCGINGWYAANKGRLVYPRAQNCTANQAAYPTVGDYPKRPEPTAMNSFRYSLATPRPNDTYYNFAELYAPDRTDIPAGLPGGADVVVAGVWRLGLSSTFSSTDEPTPISFVGMTVAFRYDWRDIPETHRIAVYHHDGSPSGSWRRVSGKQSPSAENNLIATTTPIDASSQTWNAGWFAVVAEERGGLVLTFR